MSDTERHNHRQIAELNQRGGRTLSIVDLIQAGTVSIDMAAYAMRAMRQGASLLTGARPGGAGKTTLMAAILGFLPPEVPIVTVDRPQVIHEGLNRGAEEPACYLVHEIGAGHWFGYLWGSDVADYFSLVNGSRRIASCLHADTLDELTEILCSPPLEVRRADLGRVGLILFMHVSGRWGNPQRRVASLWEADGNGRHRLLFQWNAQGDAFAQVGELHHPEELRDYGDFLRRLLDDGEVETGEVRRRVVKFYRSGR